MEVPVFLEPDIDFTDKWLSVAQSEWAARYNDPTTFELATRNEPTFTSVKQQSLVVTPAASYAGP